MDLNEALEICKEFSPDGASAFDGFRNMLELTEDYTEGRLSENPLTAAERTALNMVYDKMKWMFE